MVAVVVDDYSNQVKLNVVRYAVYGAVGHSTLAQRLALLLGDAVVGRLPTADATRLDLHEVQRVEVLRDDVYLVVSYAPVALHDVVTTLTKPRHSDILATRANLLSINVHRSYFVRRMRKSMFSPGCTSYVATPFLKIRIGREPMSWMPLSSMRNIQPSRRPTT